MRRQWTVYIVRCRDGTFYTGISKDVKNRLAQHNSGKGAKYIVKKRRPVKLVYLEGKRNIGDAMRREIEIKKTGASGKLSLARRYKRLHKNRKKSTVTPEN